MQKSPNQVASKPSKPVKRIPAEPFAHCPFIPESAISEIPRKRQPRGDTLRAWGALSVLLSPSACLVVALNDSGRLTLWDIPSDSARAVVESGGKKPSQQGLSMGAPDGMVLSADESLLAAGFEDGEVRVWNANSGEAVRRLSSPPTKSALPIHLAFGQNGTTLLVVYRDRSRLVESICVWDIASGALLRQQVMPNDFIGLQGDVKGGWYAISGSGGSRNLWDLQTDKSYSVAVSGNAAVRETVLLARAHLLLLRTTSGIQLWDYQASERRYSIQGCPEGAAREGIRVDGGVFLVRCEDKVVFRELATGALLRKIDTDLANDNTMESGGVRDGRHPEVSFKNQGKWVQLLRVDGRSQIWDVKSGVMINEFVPPNPPENLWLFPGGAQSSSNGRFLLTAEDDFLSVWDTQAKRVLRSFDGWVSRAER